MFTPEITCCSAVVDLMNSARYKSFCFGPRMAVWAFCRREITVNTAGRGLDPHCLDTKTSYLKCCMTPTPSLTVSQPVQNICTICILYFYVRYIFLNHLQRAASTWTMDEEQAERPPHNSYQWNLKIIFMHLADAFIQRAL